MAQHNVGMKKARKMVRWVLDDPRTTKEGKQWAREMLNHLRDAEASYEDAITEAEMRGYRNPEFDGDYVGWLPDDFDDDEDDYDD